MLNKLIRLLFSRNVADSYPDDILAYEHEKGIRLILAIRELLVQNKIERTDDEEDLYDKNTCIESYYNQLANGSIKSKDFSKIPLIWKIKGKYYLLSGFVLRDNRLLAEAYDLQTGPPDFGTIYAEFVGIDVLSEAYKILNNILQVKNEFKNKNN